MIHTQGTAAAVDVHTHLAPKIAPAALSEIGLTELADGRYAIDESPLGPVALYSETSLIDYLEANDLDEGFVALPPPFFRQALSGEAAASWVKQMNQGIVDRCKASPKLRPMRYIPFEHPVLATAIVRDGLGEDDHVGWTAAAGGNCAPLDHPDFTEMWSLLAADGRPLLLHPAESPDKRLHPHYLHNLLGNPVETGVAVGELVLGGVLASHPLLRIVLVHCGGVVPSVAARWQRGIDTARPGVNTALPSVHEQLRKVYTDCLTHDQANVDLARHVFGDDQLLLGSDWPFPMGLNNPREPIAHLSPALQHRIACDNPARLLALEPSR